MELYFWNGTTLLRLVGMDIEWSIYYRATTQTYIVALLPQYENDSVTWSQGYYDFRTYTEAKKFMAKKTMKEGF